MIEYVVIGAALAASLWYLWRHYLRDRFHDADGEPVGGDASGRRGPGCTDCDGC